MKIRLNHVSGLAACRPCILKQPYVQVWLNFTFAGHLGLAILSWDTTLIIMGILLCRISDLTLSF